MAFSPYRRAIVQESKKRGGKGPRGNWRERFRPSKDHAEPFVIIAGEYKDNTQQDSNVQPMIDMTGRPVEMVLPYYPYEKHVRSVGPKKIYDEICSRGPNPHQPMPCVGCYAEQTGDRSIKLNSAYAVGIAHLVVYHGHPILDTQKNQYIVKQEGPQKGQYVIAYDECEGRSCNFCRLLRSEQPILLQGETFPYYAKDITSIFGRRRFLDIGKNGLQDILGWDLSIGSVCFGPGFLRHPQTQQLILDQQTQQPIPAGICGNQLTTVSWNCTICNNVIIDMSTDPRTDEQIQQATMEPYPCIHCQRPVDLREVVICELCNQGKQVTVFSGEAVVWVKRQGEGTGTHMVMEKFESLDSFIANPSNFPPQLIPPGKSAKDVVTEIMRPYDFSELLKPKDLAGQSKRLDLPIPPQYAGAAMGYGQPPSGYGPPAGAPGYPQGQQPAGAPPLYGPPPTGYGPPNGSAPVAGQPYTPPMRPNYGS
jgi:hypothetical protein